MSAAVSRKTVMFDVPRVGAIPLPQIDVVGTTAHYEILGRMYCKVLIRLKGGRDIEVHFDRNPIYSSASEEMKADATDFRRRVIEALTEFYQP